MQAFGTRVSEANEVMVKKRTRIAMAATAALIVYGSMLAAQQPPPAGGDKPDPVAALKQSIAEGTKKRAQYEGVESTVISLKGEEKARKQNRCDDGADGKVQKIAIAGAPKADEGGGGKKKKGGGMKGKIVENKKNDMTEYMKQAAALIQSYVPPKPEQIQAVKEGGRLAMTPQGAGKSRIEMKQYLKPSDSLTIDLDTAANRLLGLGVNSYIDKPEDTVTLAVQMTTLPDGAMYAAKTTLDAKAKDITVVITNSGHRPMAK
jgi:hypothetical protein